MPLLPQNPDFAPKTPFWPVFYPRRRPFGAHFLLIFGPPKGPFSPFGDPDFPFLGAPKPGKSPVSGSPATPENGIFGGFPGRQKGVFPGRGPHFGQKTPQNGPQKFSRPGQKKTPLFPPMVSRFSTLFGSVFGPFFPFYALVGPKMVSAGTPPKGLFATVLGPSFFGIFRPGPGFGGFSRSGAPFWADFPFWRPGFPLLGRPKGGAAARNRLQKGILAQNRAGTPENAILGGSGRPKPGFLRFLTNFRKNAIFPN